MTKDDIIKLAREAGYQLEAFAKLVAEHEREACAKVCEQPIDEIQITDDCSEVRYMDGKECADAIRARSQA